MAAGFSILLPGGYELPLFADRRSDDQHDHLSVRLVGGTPFTIQRWSTRRGHHCLFCLRSPWFVVVIRRSKFRDHPFHDFLSGNRLFVHDGVSKHLLFFRPNFRTVCSSRTTIRIPLRLLSIRFLVFGVPSFCRSSTRHHFSDGRSASCALKWIYPQSPTKFCHPQESLPCSVGCTSLSCSSTVALPLAMSSVYAPAGPPAAGALAGGRVGSGVVAQPRHGAGVGFHEGRITRWPDALPMHLCDWASFAVIIALVWRGQLAYELAYLWGLSGTFQAVLTPDLTETLPNPFFIGFFVDHCGIIVSVLFLTWGLGMRPTPEPCRGRVVGARFTWCARVRWTGSVTANYGYLRRQAAHQFVARLFRAVALVHPDFGRDDGRVFHGVLCAVLVCPGGVRERLGERPSLGTTGAMRRPED